MTGLREWHLYFTRIMYFVFYIPVDDERENEIIMHRAPTVHRSEHITNL